MGFLLPWFRFWLRRNFSFQRVITITHHLNHYMSTCYVYLPHAPVCTGTVRAVLHLHIPGSTCMWPKQCSMWTVHALGILRHTLHMHVRCTCTYMYICTQFVHVCTCTSTLYRPVGLLLFCYSIMCHGKMSQLLTCLRSWFCINIHVHVHVFSKCIHSDAFTMP